MRHSCTEFIPLHLFIDSSVEGQYVYRRMTLKVSKPNKKSFLLSIFNTLNTSQKGCIILHDEEYIKIMLLYHGKQLFGKSVENPSLLAQTVLSIMLICLNGGPKFLTKLIPISKLTSAFLFETN